MSSSWSGTAPTDLFFRWNDNTWESDQATFKAVSRAIADAEVVQVTPTGPALVVSNDDELAIWIKVVKFWQQMLNPAQFDRMAWIDPPTFDEVTIPWIDY